MKIKREINGTVHEFELTSNELFEAYYEQEHKFDVDDMEDLICGLENEYVLEVYGVSAERFRELEPEMAYEKRRLMDKYDMAWNDARDEAVDRILEKYQCEAS